VLPRDRNIILDELVVDSRRPVRGCIVEFDVMAAEIFENGRGLDDEDAIERALPDIQWSVR